MLLTNELHALRPVSPNGCIGPGASILLLSDLCPSDDRLQSSKGGVEALHCSPWFSLQLQAVKAWLCHLGCHACTACLQGVPCWGAGLQLPAHHMHRWALCTLLFVCCSCFALVVRAERPCLLGLVMSCAAWVARESNCHTIMASATQLAALAVITSLSFILVQQFNLVSTLQLGHVACMVRSSAAHWPLCCS